MVQGDHVEANGECLKASLQFKKFNVLSAGFVCLVDVMGDDSAVVQAARVSYGTGTKRLSDDRGLIRYLMRHRHTTPFEMAELKFLVHTPMDTWRQWIRHRTANVNEYSTRYSEAIDEMDETPCTEWRLQSTTNKQGSSGKLEAWPPGISCGDGKLVVSNELLAGMYQFTDTESLDGFDSDTTPGDYLSQREKELHAHAREVYQERLAFGVAREQARKDLPLSTYTRAYWKVDLHNLLHFLSLRMDSHAQQEIRGFATVIGEQIVKPLFPLVWEAFVDYRLRAKTISGPAVDIIRHLVQAAREDHAIDPTADLLPPWNDVQFEHVACSLFPEWFQRHEDGTLKRHRERDEVWSLLQNLGLAVNA